MDLLHLRPRELDAAPASPSAQLDVTALDSALITWGAEAAVSVDGAAGPSALVAQPVSLVSREPPLLLATIAQDAPALGELLMRRAFTVTLGRHAAHCRLHATADAGECAVIVGRVLAV